MSLLNDSADKAREVIDFCMANESPELKAKVYEIINLSGLEPNDPMFITSAFDGTDTSNSRSSSRRTRSVVC